MCAHIVTGETALFTIEADNVARYLWQVCEGDTGIWHSVESGVDDSGTLTVPYDPDNALRTWRCVLIGLTGDEVPTDVVSVTYYPSAPSNVTILNDATRVSVGGTLALGAELYPSDACQIVTWTSSNIAAATVDADGRVTGVAAGTATITAMAVNGVTASLKVEVMYLDVTTSLPARTTAKSAISSNLSQIDTIRQSASSVVTSLGKSGAITLTEAAERRAIVNRAFAMLEFPWMTLSTQEYWKQEYAYKRYVPGTVYYGLPYIQTGANDNLRNREYNVSKALSENRYYDSGSGYYILNRNNLLSSMYVGNDCSSFVSMATFGLSHPASFYNTTNLAGSRYHRSISFSELRPGDMMVRAYNHTVMFLYWVDETKTRCMIIEQGGGDNSNTVSCSIKSISAYSNFTPRRVATFR